MVPSCALAPDGAGHVTIPSGWTAVTQGAFRGCGSLRSVSLPDTLREVAPEAFRASALTEVVLPDSVITVGERAFAQCRSLTHIWLGSSVANVGVRAFYESTALTGYNLPLSLTSMGHEAIEKTAITNVCVEGLGTRRFL